MQKLQSIRDSIVRRIKNIPTLLREPIGIVIIAAVVIRLVYFVAVLLTTGKQSLFFNDSVSYSLPAQTFLECGKFLTAAGEVDILRTPGYILFLSFIMLFFGFEHYWVGAAIAQILLSGAAIYALYRICQMVAPGTKAGLIAAIAAAVCPMDIRYVSVILSDSFAQSLSIISLYFFVRYLRSADSPRFSDFAAGCVLLSYTVLTRPSFMLLPLCIMVGVAVVLLLRRNWKQAVSVALAVLLICMAPLGIWCLRNSIVSDYDGVSPVSAVNLYKCNAAYVYAKQNGMSYYEASGYLNLAGAELEIPEGGTIYDAYNQRGMEIILSDIPTYLEGCLVGVAMSYFYPGMNDFVGGLSASFWDSVMAVKQLISEEPSLFSAGLRLLGDGQLFAKVAIVVLDVIALVFIFAVAVFGLFKIDWKKNWYIPALLLGTLLYLTAVHCQPVGYGAHARYRISFNLVEFVFFGVGMHSLMGIVREKWLSRKARKEQGK